METTLITGASRGIGLGLTQRFLEAGHRVFATCRAPEEATELKALAGASALHIHRLDVVQEDSVAALAERLSNETIDVLINNAGALGTRKQSLNRMDYDQWRHLFEVNTIAPFRVISAFQNQLMRSANPRIMTVSARMASFSRTDTGFHAYRSTKAALNKLMQVLAIELKDNGIVVCSVHPGWVATDMSGGTGELTVEACSNDLFTLADGLTMNQSGRFWTWSGEELSW
ncbi:MAG: SDR family oxidoreductase [Pseudomonadota bacterium]